MTPSDLLVIAPYNAQVASLSRAIRATGLDIPVGTVDRFQGEERPV